MRGGGENESKNPGEQYDVAVGRAVNAAGFPAGGPGWRTRRILSIRESAQESGALVSHRWKRNRGMGTDRYEVQGCPMHERASMSPEASAERKRYESGERERERERERGGGEVVARNGEETGRERI